jgi:filamentous hemagglutinin family protein
VIIRRYGRNQLPSRLFKHSIVFLATLMTMNSAFANPQGGVVTNGSASINSSGNTTVIQQNSQQAIIQWNSFNIQNGEKTQFVQPNSSSVALNRINPNQGVSQINGSLSSNGQIVLINAAGIHFGSSAMVNVGSMIASTSDISDANFLAGKYIFDQASSYRNATITNQGKIVAANYGLVALLGNSVINNGMVQAELGRVILGSGSKFTLAFNGDQLINFTVDAPATSGGAISNTGTLVADGGQVLVTAQAASGVLDSVIDMSGTVQANSVSQQNGEIILSSNAGVNVSGKLVANGGSAGSGNSGGTIQISANKFTSSSHAVMDTSGDIGGGSINIAANTIQAGGLLNAAGTGSSALGGNVQLTGNYLELLYGATINANGQAGGGTVAFSAATAASNAAIYLDPGSLVAANALASGVGGNIGFNSSYVLFNDSWVSAASTGAFSGGGYIHVAANNINIANGSWLNANGDFVGGSVTLSGVPVSGNMANAAQINLDSWSAITANANGADSVVGGNINLYANNELISGVLSANDTMSNGIGGNIGVYGDNIYLQNAYVDASAGFVGGNINLGGNPLSTASNNSSNVSVNYFSDVTSAVTGNNGFGGSVTISANMVNIAGEIDVSGNPFPYLTFTNSGGNTAYNNFCGGGGGFHLTPVINNSGSSAGVITVTGNNITVAAGGYLNAAGNVFGGEILLGSDPSNAVATTASLNINSGSLLDAGSYGTTNNPIGGLIRLYANNTSVNGTLNTSGAANSGSLAGEVEVFANNTVTLGSWASIYANGAADGGEVLVGGDLHGQGFDPSAQNTNVAATALISASALTNGTGGEVVIWSANTTNFAGTILARGGAAGGDGGEVEVSGAQTLNFTNSAYVDVRAPHGHTGTLFLDPANMTISNTGSSSAGNTVLSAYILDSELQMANVIISTDSSSAQTGDITVANNVSWNTSNSLTLNAFRNINVNATISNNAGGSLTLNADSSQDGTGTVNFGSKGSVNMNGGGSVSVTYNPINVSLPNYFFNNIHVSFGSTVAYNPLNVLVQSNS